MEKESGIPKAGDLFIGVIDLFGILIPGLIGAALIGAAAGTLPETDLLSLSALAIAGWVLGHVLHGIGRLIDPLLYDPLFKPRKRDAPKKLHPYFHKNDELYWLAEGLTESRLKLILPETAGVPGGMYQWARAFLDSRSPEAAAHLDRLEADSKLFRSLAVLLVIATPLVILSPNLNFIPRLPLIILILPAILFSLWRYCDLRNKMIRRCYLHYVQLSLDDAPLTRAGN